MKKAIAMKATQKQWATIIQPEKMTLGQIEKELGRKIQII